jgi:hypothetical protein
MSPYFLIDFKKKHPCPKCKRLTVRSLCPDHLWAARERWRLWQLQRKLEGLCSYCHRKSFKGYVRCRLHTLYNRKKCKVWMAKNGKERYEYRKLVGVCVRSPQHGVAAKGHVYCQLCLNDRKEWRDGKTKKIRLSKHSS